MRLTLVSLSLAVLVSCADTSQPVQEAEAVTYPETTLPVFGDGYPNSGDVCRRFGESAETVEFLDHTRALVGCPEAWTGREAFAADVNAEEVLRQDGWVLYSIPLGF